MGDVIDFPGNEDLEAAKARHPSQSGKPRDSGIPEGRPRTPKLGYSGIVVLLVATSSFLLGLTIGLALLILFGG